MERTVTDAYRLRHDNLHQRRMRHTVATETISDTIVYIKKIITVVHSEKNYLGIQILYTSGDIKLNKENEKFFWGDYFFRFYFDLFRFFFFCCCFLFIFFLFDHYYSDRSILSQKQSFPRRFSLRETNNTNPKRLVTFNYLEYNVIYRKSGYIQFIFFVYSFVISR